MKVRSVALAFVSSVYLVALGANIGSALATTNPVTSQAYQALTSGDSAKAISLYSFAIESRGLEPEVLANALLNRALAYQQQGQSAKAVDDYSAALALDAMSAELRATALYNRGLSQQKQGYTPLAIEDFTSALMLNPGFAHAFLSRANALRESGQYLFALSDYERALKFGHPEPARVYFGEAQTYELLNRPSDMRQMLNSAVMADAQFVPAQEKLASLGQQSKNADSATAEVASTVDPILTGTVVAVGGSTIIHKPDLPQGVEPPANLTAEVAAQTDAVVAQGEEPVFSKVGKLYNDRLPTSAEETARADVAPVGSQEKIVAVAEVPAIPKSTKAKKVLASAVVAADETIETASVTPVAKPKALAAPVAGWGVQVASAASEDAAWTTWKNMQKRFKILADKSPVVVKADLGTRGIFYRVRLAGFDDQLGAKSECNTLKSKGVSCFISKSEGAT
jgi:tetratricopeptide (TPR) repeat protein